MKIIITVIRMAVGWHFLYEGISKLVVEGWSSETYLLNTNGWFSGFYHWLAMSPVRLEIVDIMNICGLIFIGLALFIGAFTRLACLSGIFLLALYYFAYPPFGISLLNSWEGHFFIVDKLFLEAAILVFLFFCKEKGYSLDALWQMYKHNKRRYNKQKTKAPELTKVVPISRREILKNLASIPALGILGAGACLSQRVYGVDVTSGATIQLNQLALNELKGDLPVGKIGNLEISRLIMGGNLIAGWSHARDLVYVNSLFKAYNTERKVYETLSLAEKAGINTISIGYTALPLIAKYKEIMRSKINIIAQVEIPRDGQSIYGKNIYEHIDKAIDLGVSALQVSGNLCDWCVRDERLDVLEKMLDRIRSQRYVAGLGAHTIDSFITCEEKGIIPDYYMKTMHHDNYWSAHPRENRKPFEVDGQRSLDHNMFHDNCFCPFPDRTIEFVNRVKVPVVGFKVLAAGAIEPKDGFKWAFENGADFICVGMFDFQVVDDVNICIDTLTNLESRNRKWFG